MAAVDGVRYSQTVLSSVLKAFDLSRDDVKALLEAAAELDDGNGYLNRAELEAAAEAIAGEEPPPPPGGGDDLGIISDIDDTIIPKHDLELEPPPPFAGVVELYNALEAVDGDLGDTYYVTARSPERVKDLPEYFAEHGLPEGSIDTGTSQLPWLAQPEKVRDITRIFEANPGKRFVLIGDSSHRDPEVYREIMDAFPDQVAAVIIH
jgi:phosphatidate phosphatase APP1